MKKILFIAKFPPPYTGQTVGTKLLFESLSNSTLFESRKVDFSVGFKKGKGLLNKLTYNFFTILAFFKKLRLLINNKNVDVVYGICPSSFKGLLQIVIVFFSTGFFKKKIFLHVRTGNLPELYKNFLSRKILDYMIRKKVFFIFLSEKLKNSTNQFIDNSQKAVLYNQIDEAVISSKQENKTSVESRKKSKTIQLCYISNFINSKGYLDFLKSLKYVKSMNTINAIFVGSWLSESDKRKFISLSKKLKLSDSVIILDPIYHREKLKEIYKKSHIFCLPTYYPYEAQPRSIIEAFANSTPVISCNHASIPEYVENYHNGILVDKKSPKQIADAIEEISSPSNWIKYSKNAQSTFLKKFNTKELNNQFIKIINTE